MEWTDVTDYLGLAPDSKLLFLLHFVQCTLSFDHPTLSLAIKLAVYNALSSPSSL